VWRRVAEGPAARQNAGSAAEINERQALAMFRAGQTAEARPLLLELVARQGEKASATLRLALADALLEARDPRSAREHVSAVVQADAYNAGAWRRLAQCHAALGEFDLALTAAQRALAADDEDPVTLELAAAIALRAGKAEQARVYAQKLVRFSPDGENNPVARVILSRAKTRE
jgi:Tfp pilus assembly protein PilF